MGERTVRVPKILCHADGSVFANWSPKHEAYACCFSDEDTPPAPETLKITTYHPSITDHASLVWKPVIQVVQVGEPGEVEVTGPYDVETGEGV